MDAFVQILVAFCGFVFFFMAGVVIGKKVIQYVDRRWPNG